MTGAELNAWRKTHGLTETQAAEIAGVSQAMWNMVESGERKIDSRMRSAVLSYRGRPSLAGKLQKASRGPYKGG